MNILPRDILVRHARAADDADVWPRRMAAIYYALTGARWTEMEAGSGARMLEALDAIQAGMTATPARLSPDPDGGAGHGWSSGNAFAQRTRITTPKVRSVQTG